MDYKFEVVEAAEQQVLAVRTITSVGNLPQEIGKAFQAIAAYLDEIGEQPEDAPFAGYFNMDMEELDVEMGFPVAKTLPGKGDIKVSKIPAGKKATCMFKGPYSAMAPIYNAMNQWMSENGYQPSGVVYEFYYNSPIEVPESELLTKIVFLLK